VSYEYDVNARARCPLPTHLLRDVIVDYSTRRVRNFAFARRPAACRRRIWSLHSGGWSSLIASWHIQSHKNDDSF